MSQNLACYMHMRTLLIVIAVTIVTKVVMAELGWVGYVYNLLDYTIPVYLGVSVILDIGDEGFKIKCLLFDILIAFIMWSAYFLLLVIVGYTYDLIIAFFQYVIFG